MGKIKKTDQEISIIADVKEFLDFPVPDPKGEPRLPLGFYIAIAAKRKLQELKHEPFHLSLSMVEIDDGKLKVTFSR